MKEPESDATVITPMPAPTVSIDDDFNAWSLYQAAASRRLRPNSLDWQNLVEELEAMARKDRTSLRSHLQNLLSHLLKWHFQPSHRSTSWKRAIDESRDCIEDRFDESPSLRIVLRQLFAESKAYARAVRDALRGNWSTALSDTVTLDSGASPRSEFSSRSKRLAVL